MQSTPAVPEAVLRTVAAVVVSVVLLPPPQALRVMTAATAIEKGNEKKFDMGDFQIEESCVVGLVADTLATWLLAA